MKLKSFLIAALVLTGFVGNVWAQKDVTSTYLTNFDFSTGTPIDNNVCTYGKDMAANGTTYYGAQAIAGWTNASVGDTDNGYANSKLAGGLFAYGSTPWIGGSGTAAPATGPSGNSGNAAGLCAVWGGRVQYTQAVTFPEGSYTVVFKVYNATSGNGNSSGIITTNLFGFVADSGVTYYAPNNTFAIGQWSTVVVTFNLTTSTTGKISMGYVGPSGNAAMPHLFIDNVRILKNGLYTDKTSSVNSTGWTGAGDGYQGGTINTARQYGNKSIGRHIYQTISGLDNGTYEVSLFSISQKEWNGSLASDAGDVAYVFAEGAYELKEWINARSRNSYPGDENVGVYTISGVKVTNGTLTLGMGLAKADLTEWHHLQIKSLVYTNEVDLSSYKEARDFVKNAALEAIASNLIPTACNNAIQNAIDTYGGDYNTAEDYTNAKEQIQEALDTYFADGLQSAYTAYYAFKAQVEGLMTGVDDGETKTTFANAISTATANVEAATTAAAISTQQSNLRAAAMTFISTTDNHQFDITFLASKNYADWKKKDGSAAGEVTWAVKNRGDWTFAENYETTCATTGTVLYQTVNDLPEGYYQVGMFAMAAYTSGRGFDSEATEGDANRSFAFAGNLDDANSILRTGIAIPFKTEFDFSELTTLDVNVHLALTGNLTFGIQKDANGSNWHFAQIASIVYSNQPDLTNLKATRDALVSAAEGLLNGSADYLTSAQQAALQSAITAGNAASDFETLNTVTLTTLPNAINTAKQQVQLVKDNRVLMLAALERFENDYNLADGTDYSRATMSAKAWTDLLAKVNAVSAALDDVSQSTSYGTVKDALVAQLDATDASLRLFKSYKAMTEGTKALSITEGTTYSADSYMDSDAAETDAISAMNTAFTTYANAQDADFSLTGFLGENLDFNTAQADKLTTVEEHKIYDIVGWEEEYANLDANCFIENSDASHLNQLYIRSNWTSKAVMLKAFKQRMLPVGKYRLSFSWNSNLENMTNLSVYVIGADSTAIGEASTEAKTLTYEFEVAEAAQPFDLCFGLIKTNTGNTPAQILADDITLTYLRPAEDLLARDYDPSALWFDATDAKYASAKNVEVTPTAPNQIIKAAAADQFSGLSKNVIVDGTCANFVITDGAPLAIQEDFTATSATYSRAMSNDWGTIILPFALASNESVQFYALKASNAESMTFSQVAEVAANSPVAFKKMSGEAITLSASDAAVVATKEQQVDNTTADNWRAEGSYTIQSVEDYTGIYYIASNKFWAADGKVTLNPFRAMFRNTGPTQVKAFSIFVDVATGIDRASTEAVSDGIYDLSGRQVATPKKPGLYIREGKKIVIK